MDAPECSTTQHLLIPQADCHFRFTFFFLLLSFDIFLWNLLFKLGIIMEIKEDETKVSARQTNIVYAMIKANANQKSHELWINVRIHLMWFDEREQRRVAGLAVSILQVKPPNEQTKEERRKLVRLLHTLETAKERNKITNHNIVVVTVSVRHVWRNGIELDFRAQVTWLCAPATWSAHSHSASVLLGYCIFCKWKICGQKFYRPNNVGAPNVVYRKT